jgi:hypothetical protein
MLRSDAAQYVKKNKFSLYGIRTIDEGIEIFTDVTPEHYHDAVKSGLTKWRLKFNSTKKNGE